MNEKSLFPGARIDPADSLSAMVWRIAEAAKTVDKRMNPDKGAGLDVHQVYLPEAEAGLRVSVIPE